jgi:hypothetical protein
VASLESWYRMLMLAYPSRYRRDRGQEMLGTLLDLASRGQRLPAPRDAADIVRGGLAARWRQQPLLRREVLWAAGFLALAIALPVPGKWWMWPLAGGSSIAADLFWSRWHRRRMLRKHGLHLNDKAPGRPSAR